MNGKLNEMEEKSSSLGAATLTLRGEYFHVQGNLSSQASSLVSLFNFNDGHQLHSSASLTLFTSFSVLIKIMNLRLTE
jgi:hypothetical protein